MFEKRNTQTRKLNYLIENQVENPQITDDVPEIEFFPRFLNLSDCELTDEEKVLLNKGIKYCPKHELSNDVIQNLAVDIENSLDRQETAVKYKCVDTLKQCMKSNQPNFNSREFSLIKQIKNKCIDQDVTITKADKNDSIVFFQTSEYDSKMRDFLSNNDAVLLPRDPTNKYQGDVKNVIKYSCLLTEKEKFKLINKNPTVPKIYGLAKVHKTGIPLRPVVSYRTAPAFRLAKKTNDTYRYFTKFKNPYSTYNSIEVVDKLKNIEVPPGAKLVSFDVVNLFPSIPVPELKTLLEENIQRTTKLNPLLKKELYDFMCMCLDQNYFAFKNRIYSQRDGLPMGSPLSSLCAEIFMYHLEKKILEEENEFKDKVIYWVRYVDDILCLFSDTEEEIQRFSQYLNSLHRNIQFTTEYINEGRSINFLDLTISLRNGKHEFEIFHKPTSTDVTIPWDSSHCIIHKRAAFTYYFDRLLRTPMTEENYKKEYNRILRIGLNNGYSLHWIKKILESRRKIQMCAIICPSHQQSQKKKTTSNKLKRLIETDTRKVALYPNRVLGRTLYNRKDTLPNDKKSGVYKLICNDCNGYYVGQTARSFEKRIKEHVSAHTNKAMNKSNFAQHLLEENHSFNPTTGVKYLHFCEGGRTLNVLESIEIRRNNPDGKILNFQLDVLDSPLIRFVTSVHDNKTK
uniref:Reverse transcriptase domain-containing protein n=1 Tax=Cacopsylla melanoneura TaxID=428564 RepID=A0A8D8QQH8_9HEMI